MSAPDAKIRSRARTRSVAATKSRCRRASKASFGKYRRNSPITFSGSMNPGFPRAIFESRNGFATEKKRRISAASYPAA